jgi:hypothetical protein
MWLSYQFPVVHQRRTLSVGETATVYQLQIPSGCYGFVYSLANSYVTDSSDNTKGTNWWIYIDDASLEPTPISRELGTVTNPWTPPRPYVVKNMVKAVCYNGCSEECEVEFMAFGLIFTWSD